ncbi:protein canopy homolog 3 [Fopius arisanus]|uniref:Protein canopy homolog 3 n=1 Tax=Fopius arisanus TaxID=64838 RepID=A0A9R1TA21_9HYME|nr:PREDICTED: protein canopy homolog 3 [Fopius arisanus]
MLPYILLTILVLQGIYAGPEEEHGVKYASKCEVCKVLALELESRLNETGKSHDVLELGYSLDDVAPKKKKEYRKSELRLVESLENVCERILQYNVHKERHDSTRFAKGMSQTFQTLHGLVDKGVKVDLGIPYELWDSPSAEITDMKTKCEDLLENYETDIEVWYYLSPEEKPSLGTYLCAERALSNEDASCLREKGDVGALKIEGDKPKKKEQNDKMKKKKSEKKAKANKQEL